MAVISELQRSLNFETGGEVVQRLTDLYDVARTKILEATITSSKETIEWLPAVLSSIREAWQPVEQTTAGQPGTALAAEAPRTVPTAPVDAPETKLSRGQWDAWCDP